MEKQFESNAYGIRLTHIGFVGKLMQIIYLKREEPEKPELVADAQPEPVEIAFPEIDKVFGVRITGERSVAGTEVPFDVQSRAITDGELVVAYPPVHPVFVG